MNIKEAKEQIKNAMTAYFTKDDYGNYVIPIEKQRPVFLMGPPGIGKTAIMAQIASRLYHIKFTAARNMMSPNIRCRRSSPSYTR